MYIYIYITEANCRYLHNFYMLIIKIVYIYIYIYIYRVFSFRDDREGWWFDTLCNVCIFACQQRELKTFR